MNLFNLIEEHRDENLVHKKELSELRFLDALREEARNSHSVIKKSPIYCMETGPDMMMVTPEAREERSSFWIDKLIKQVPGWQRFPSRSKCVRAFTSLERLHGDIYVVIPVDRARIGICPGKSFYRSFEEFKKSFDIERLDNPGLLKWLNAAKTGLNELVKDSKIKMTEPESFMEFMRQVESLDDALKQRASIRHKMKDHEGLGDEERKAVQDLLNRHITDMKRYLEEKVDPEANGFSVVRVESFHSAHADKEVWTDSPCLLIRRNTYIEMYKNGVIK